MVRCQQFSIIKHDITLHTCIFMHYKYYETNNHSFSSGSTSQSLASSNKESSILWKSLSEEERQKYNEDAKKKSGNLKEVNVKKECKKMMIVSHLQEMVLHVVHL